MTSRSTNELRHTESSDRAGRTTASDDALRLGAVDPANFYLASAAVIPILALVQAVGQDVKLRTKTEVAQRNLQWLAARSRIGNFLWVALEAALFIWAEWICLRRLEVGHAPFGGSRMVWIALAYGALNASMVRLGSYVTADDVQALTSWAERTGRLNWRRPGTAREIEADGVVSTDEPGDGLRSEA